MHSARLGIPAVGLLATVLVLTSATPVRAQAPAAPAQAPVVAPAPPAALDRAALEKKVDELLNAHVALNDFSGTVLLASAGTPLVAKGYGFANVEWQIPNTPQTKFRIGSVTKQFTSMLIMQLREQGKLKLEDSVCVYLEPCPAAWKLVTIHHLLTHTSGIPSYTGIASWRAANMVPKTVEQMIAIFRDLPLQWDPGERYAYNNSGYFLLGAVIEKVAGRKYEEALQEMILTPLGLKDTGYDWSRTIIARRASGYEGAGAAKRNAAALDMQQPYAAGSLYSTVEDLLMWEQALYTEKLLPEAAKKIMWTPFLEGYAYGWSIQPASPMTFGHLRIAHSGGINGFSAMLMRVPGTNVTAIVLSNNSTVNASTVARELLAIYYGQPYTVPVVKTIVNVDPAIFDRYAGKYEVRPGFEHFPSSETSFFAKIADITVTFVSGPDGKVTHLTLVQAGRTQQAKKIE